MATRYGPKTKKNVERVMHERKHGTLRSGSGRKVTNPKQAIAIALSESRREGDKVPSRRKRGGRRKASGKRKATGTRKKSTARRTPSAGRKRGGRTRARR